VLYCAAWVRPTHNRCSWPPLQRRRHAAPAAIPRRPSVRPPSHPVTLSRGYRLPPGIESLVLSAPAANPRRWSPLPLSFRLAGLVAHFLVGPPILGGGRCVGVCGPTKKSAFNPSFASLAHAEGYGVGPVRSLSALAASLSRFRASVRGSSSHVSKSPHRGKKTGQIAPFSLRWYLIGHPLVCLRVGMMLATEGMIAQLARFAWSRFTWAMMAARQYSFSSRWLPAAAPRIALASSFVVRTCI